MRKKTTERRGGARRESITVKGQPRGTSEEYRVAKCRKYEKTSRKESEDLESNKS